MASARNEHPFVFDGKHISHNSVCGVSATTPVALGPTFKIFPDRGALAAVRAVLTHSLSIGGTGTESPYSMPGFFPRAGPRTVEPRLIISDGDTSLTGSLVAAETVYAKDLIATGPKSPIDGSYDQGGSVWASLVDTKTIATREIILKGAQMAVSSPDVVISAPFPQTVLVSLAKSPVVTVNLASFAPAGTRVTIKEWSNGRCSEPHKSQIVIKASDGAVLDGLTGNHWTIPAAPPGGAATLEYATPCQPGGISGWFVVSSYGPGGLPGWDRPLPSPLSSPFPSSSPAPLPPFSSFSSSGGTSSFASPAPKIAPPRERRSHPAPASFSSNF